jgi:hypothetical protein
VGTVTSSAVQVKGTHSTGMHTLLCGCPSRTLHRLSYLDHAVFIAGLAQLRRFINGEVERLKVNTSVVYGFCFSAGAFVFPCKSSSHQCPLVLLITGEGPHRRRYGRTAALRLLVRRLVKMTMMIIIFLSFS